MSVRKETLKKWQALIQQQSDSGLPVTKFCKTNRLSITCFYKYKKILESETSPDTKSSFVKIQQPKVTSNGNVIKIQHHNTTLSLPTAIEPDWIASLLKALV